ncbi:MAG: PP2C family protein-serine/threonine phosphatase, partial [Planctomycetota bacterium]
EYINAGHWPPLVRRPGGEVTQLKKARRLPVGVRKGQNYKSATFEISGDEQLCLYTDGVIDAMNEDKKVYGINRLIETVNQSDSEPHSLLRNVQQSVWNYMGKAEQHDDTTVICFGPK